MESFQKILSQPTLFRNRDVLSPHHIPDALPHREREIEKIMTAVSPALKGERPKNLLIYGKTGTGKTSSVKFVAERFAAAESRSRMVYVNCRIYNSRFRVFQKLVKDLLPQYDKPGHGFAFFYEKLIDWVEEDGRGLIIILDEMDVVKDLDDLAYTVTRSNDDIKKGSVAIIGISNKLSFKDRLDPRSRSSLCESEMVFSPYTSFQLREILKRRVAVGFREGAVDDSAINLAAAIAAQDNGDARYALRLIVKAGEIADEKGEGLITDSHVELARRMVEEDVSFEAISTLPRHQQIVLYAIASLQMEGTRYSTLNNGNSGGLLSGEVYERYSQVAMRFGAEVRGPRWYREYLSDLEMLGLITLTESGKGQRGHTRFVRLAYSPERVLKLIEKNLLGE